MDEYLNTLTRWLSLVLLSVYKSGLRGAVRVIASTGEEGAEETAVHVSSRRQDAPLQHVVGAASGPYGVPLPPHRPVLGGVQNHDAAVSHCAEVKRGGQTVRGGGGGRAERATRRWPRRPMRAPDSPWPVLLAAPTPIHHVSLTFHAVVGSRKRLPGVLPGSVGTTGLEASFTQSRSTGSCASFGCAWHCAGRQSLEVGCAGGARPARPRSSSGAPAAPARPRLRRCRREWGRRRLRWRTRSKRRPHRKAGPGSARWAGPPKTPCRR